MKTSHKIFASLAGAALLAALVAATSFWAFGQMEAAAEARKRGFGILNSADDLLSALKDAETGQRGFLLTGDEAFLEPYLAVQNGIVGHLKKLRQATVIPAAQNHLDAMAPLIDAKLAELAQLIELRRNHDVVAALAMVGSGQGKRAMDSIRAEMKGFIQIEEGARNVHDEEFQSNLRLLFVALVGASLFTLLLAVSFALLVYRESRQRLKNLLHVETMHLLELQEETNRQLQQTNVTLQISEEKLAVTLNCIGDAVIATDAGGRMTMMNPLAVRLTGWTLADAIGRPVDEIFRIINQETRAPATIPVAQTLADGTIQGLANHTVLIARDGSECPIADSCAPIRDRDGHVVGAVLIFRDVTHEYVVQQALRDRTAQIQAILNTVADAIITIHAGGGIVEKANVAAERMFGYAEAELIGQNFSLLVPELDQDQRNGSLEYYRASEAARAAGLGREVMGRRKDGRRFPLEIAVSEMQLGGKRYFTGILRDITARKQVEAERAALNLALQEKNVELERAKSVAEKANLAKSNFLSSMSHELRSPLNAILGFAQLMDSDSPPATPSQKASIDQILHAGWYLLELINEILDLAVIESGRLSLSVEPVSLAELMGECRAMIEPQAKKRAIKLAFPNFEPAQFVRADRTRLKQVLVNFLSNAIKYNQQDGKVVVNCTMRSPVRTRISIRDTGTGLTPENLAQLFQPFNRLGQETSAEEGTGIGLVMNKRLVELMGGVIGVESTVGSGSEFWFELDTAAAPRLAVDRSKSIMAAPAQAQHGAPIHTLLYVEDNPANLALVEQLIARRPEMRLLTAINGELGIECARTNLPELILMDINLPGISGIEALKILRDDPLTAHIPVLAISANAMPGDIEKGLHAGFLRYLTKPINVNEFMAALNVALAYADDESGRRKSA